MDAKELRLNNIIRHVSTGNNNVVSPNTLLDCWEYPHRYEPTPLSPEILDKCGFYPYGESNDFAFQYGHQVGMEKYISINSDNFSIEIEHYWNGDSSTIYLQDIKYLHQLQNLYYSLTQTELNIKL